MYLRITRYTEFNICWYVPLFIWSFSKSRSVVTNNALTSILNVTKYCFVSVCDDMYSIKSMFFSILSLFWPYCYSSSAFNQSLFHVILKQLTWKNGYIWFSISLHFFYLYVIHIQYTPKNQTTAKIWMFITPSFWNWCIYSIQALVVLQTSKTINYATS